MKRMHSDSEVKRLAKQAVNPTIEEIESEISAISSTGLKREIVETLPTGSAIKTNVIYMMLDPNASTGNVYNEYMYINSNWELIGTTATVQNEVVGNPTIPSGATVTELEALKIAQTYFKVDKPVRFVKLSSTILTEALRSEILSDEYFVVIKYDNKIFYERSLDSTSKSFATLPTRNNAGTEGYNKTIGIQFYSIVIYSSSLSFIQLTVSTSSVDTGGKNINAEYINSKTDSSTNAGSGKVLTADGSGNATWETPAASGMSNPMTSADDIIVGGSSGTPTRLAKGSQGQVLKVGSSGLEWANESGGGSGMSNPMTTAGDIIVGGTSGLPERLGKGEDGQVLKLDLGVPVWANDEGTQLYMHLVRYDDTVDVINIVLVTTAPNLINNYTKFASSIAGSIRSVVVSGNNNYTSILNVHIASSGTGITFIDDGTGDINVTVLKELGTYTDSVTPL